MEGTRKRLVVGLLCSAATATACASIMGIDEPSLVDTVQGQDDGGTPGNEAGDDSTPPPLPPAPIDVACTTSPDSCGPGTYCLADSHTCTPGCKTDAECTQITGGVLKACNTDLRQCVECNANVLCKAPLACSPSGACATACPDGGNCPGGQTCCGSLCVNTKTDIDNCNGCGTKCGTGQTRCCNGMCSNPLTDKSNCGGCATVCGMQNASSTSCTNGVCKPVCNGGFGHCTIGNTGCETDTKSNTQFCGSCTTNCTTTVKNATGIACAASTCKYGACTDFHYDNNANATDGCEASCGANGVAPCCPAGPQCQGGLGCNPGHNYCK